MTHRSMQSHAPADSSLTPAQMMSEALHTLVTRCRDFWQDGTLVGQSVSGCEGAPWLVLNLPGNAETLEALNPGMSADPAHPMRDIAEDLQAQALAAASMAAGTAARVLAVLVAAAHHAPPVGGSSSARVGSGGTDSGGHGASAVAFDHPDSVDRLGAAEGLLQTLKAHMEHASRYIMTAAAAGFAIGDALEVHRAAAVASSNLAVWALTRYAAGIQQDDCNDAAGGSHEAGARLLELAATAAHVLFAAGGVELDAVSNLLAGNIAAAHRDLADFSHASAATAALVAAGTQGVAAAAAEALSSELLAAVAFVGVSIASVAMPALQSLCRALAALLAASGVARTQFHFERTPLFRRDGSEGARVDWLETKQIVTSKMPKHLVPRLQRALALVDAALVSGSPGAGGVAGGTAGAVAAVAAAAEQAAAELLVSRGLSDVICHRVKLTRGACRQTLLEHPIHMVTGFCRYASSTSAYHDTR